VSDQEVRARSSTRWSTEATTAAVLLSVGAVYAWLAGKEGLGTPGDPGAGFFPLVVAIVLVVASTTVLVQELRPVAPPDDPPAPAEPAEPAAPAAEPAEPAAPAAEPDQSTELAEPTAWGRVLGVLAAALAVPLVGDTVGFVTTLALAVVVMAKVMGTPGLVRPVLLGAAFGAVTWSVFVYWLFVPLPAGTLGLA